jgi:Glycosyl hydrolase family 65, N-terminal domain
MTNTSWQQNLADWQPIWPIPDNWMGIDLSVAGEQINWNSLVFQEKKQQIQIREGWWERSAIAHLRGGKMLKVSARCFQSLGDEGGRVLRFSMLPLNFSEKIGIAPVLDFAEKCENVSDFEPFLVEMSRETDFDSATFLFETSDEKARLAAAMRFTIYQDGEEIEFLSENLTEIQGKMGRKVEVAVETMQETVVFRFETQFFEPKKSRERLAEQATISVNRLFVRGCQQLMHEQSLGWTAIWGSTGLPENELAASSFEQNLTIWALLESWLRTDFFNKTEIVFSEKQAAGLVCFCQFSNLVFMRKTLIDRHLRNFQAMENIVFAFVVADYFRRSLDSKLYLDRGLETLVVAMRFWYESESNSPKILLKQVLESLQNGIQFVKKNDPEGWRSWMIRLRFEEKKEIRKWIEKMEKQPSFLAKMGRFSD